MVRALAPDGGPQKPEVVSLSRPYVHSKRSRYSPIAPEPGIVQMPVPSRIVPLTGSDNTTLKLSVGSPGTLSSTAICTVFDVCPGVKVSVPESAVKSLGAVALPGTVTQCTDTG